MRYKIVIMVIGQGGCAIHELTVVAGSRELANEKARQIANDLDGSNWSVRASVVEYEK